MKMFKKMCCAVLALAVLVSAFVSVTAFAEAFDYESPNVQTVLYSMDFTQSITPDTTGWSESYGNFSVNSAFTYAQHSTLTDVKGLYGEKKAGYIYNADFGNEYEVSGRMYITQNNAYIVISENFWLKYTPSDSGATVKLCYKGTTGYASEIGSEFPVYSMGSMKWANTDFVIKGNNGIIDLTLMANGKNETVTINIPEIMKNNKADVTSYSVSGQFGLRKDGNGAYLQNIKITVPAKYIRDFSKEDTTYSAMNDGWVNSYGAFVGGGTWPVETHTDNTTKGVYTTTNGQGLIRANDVGTNFEISGAYYLQTSSTYIAINDQFWIYDQPTSSGNAKFSLCYKATSSTALETLTGIEATTLGGLQYTKRDFVMTGNNGVINFVVTAGSNTQTFTFNIPELMAEKRSDVTDYPTVGRFGVKAGGSSKVFLMNISIKGSSDAGYSLTEPVYSSEQKTVTGKIDSPYTSVDGTLIVGAFKSNSLLSLDVLNISDDTTQIEYTIEGVNEAPDDVRLFVWSGFGKMIPYYGRVDKTVSTDNGN